uniref:Probable deoxycytidylate deaminase n=1 Tax=Timema californicum TaxID=61474 RepID=A0A7R9JB48_TIMCA|nr:unnamed protein product [Timema californicum]
MNSPIPGEQSEDVNKKREQYLEWADYFMATAFLAAKRSKDPCSQVGACIVSPDNKIVGVGYNGMPIGCSDDVFPWSKTTINKIDTKYLYVCHAEMNAILNKNSADVKGCTMYVGLFPCNECAKIIIQSGIVEVVYMSDKHSHKVKTQAAKRMFDFVGIKYSQYQPRMSQIVIDFTELDKNNIAPVLETPGDITHDATTSVGQSKVGRIARYQELNRKRPLHNKEERIKCASERRRMEDEEIFGDRLETVDDSMIAAIATKGETCV